MVRFPGRARLACILAVALTAPTFAIDGNQCPRFLRGDTNADGGVDLSDAVATLGYLFSGGAAPTCQDAADADDSGKLELTDAIYTLSYLFLGSAEPPAPGPVECGYDETFDDLSCESSPICDPISTPTDFSDFTNFDFRQDPGFGYCPDLERLYKVKLEKQGDGAYTVILTSLRQGTFGVDECLPRVRGSECFVPEEDPPRLLKAAEADALLDLFGAVGVYEEPDNVCHCLAIDPCRVDVFTWDENEVSGFLCGAPRVDEAGAKALTDFFETLRG